MNYEDMTQKIAGKTIDLRKAEAEHGQFIAAHQAVEAAHLEALVAVELEVVGAEGRVRKTEAELQKLARAVQESDTRRQTLRIVCGRMEQEARSLRRAELLSLRIAKGEKVLHDEARFSRALAEFLAAVRDNAQTLDEIRAIENELEPLVAPGRLYRPSLQSLLGSHIDLSQAAEYASQVAAQNRQRFDNAKQEPVIPAAELVPA